MTTHFIEPGGSSEARVTGTKPSSMPRGLGPGLVQLEAEQLRRVLRGDLPEIGLGNALEDAGEEVTRLWPRRLGMREVAAPKHVVDADRVAHLDAEVVLHELHEHVAAPVVARHQAVLRPPALREHRTLAIREVHLLEPVRDPRGFVLDRADLELGIAVEHAREDHRPQRVAHPVVGGGAARPRELAEVHRELAAGDAAARRADVHEQRHSDVLRRPPEPVVDRMAIRPVGQRRDRDERADQPQPRAALELLRGFLDVVDVEHRDALEAVGERLAELGDPIVVGVADRGEQLAVGDAVPEETLARLQARAPHAVHLVFLDHHLGVVGAQAHVLPRAEEVDLRGIFEALPGLHHGAERADLLSADHPRVELAPLRPLQPLQARRPVAKPRVDSPGIEVGRLDDVRIGRDELVRGHGILLPEPVVRRAVVPEDLALALVGDRQLQERLHRPGELRVAVREVGREDDPVVADRVDDVLDRLLVALDRDEALPLEVGARRHRQLARVDVAEPLPVLVQAPEQEGHPAAVALEEGDAQPRMALEDAARAEGAGGEHLLDRMGIDVLEHRVGAELLADLTELGARALVEAERHLELLERGPQRLVVRIVPVASVHLVRPEEHRAEAVLAHAAPRLGHGVVDVEGRDHAGAEQPLGILLAEVVEPVVVGARHGCGQAGLHVGDREGEKAARRIDDRDVDALDVHRLELHLRRPAALGVGLPALLVQGVVLALPATVAVGVDAGDAAPGLAVVGQAQIALVLREPDRRAIAERGIDVARPQVGRLDDVDVAVEDLEFPLDHGAPPLRGTVAPSRLVVKVGRGCYLIVMVPVIDLGPYLAGRPGAFAATAAELGRALETVGFFVVVNHGIPQRLIDDTFVEARRFHAQPLGAKLALRMNEHNNGYMMLGRYAVWTSDVNANDKPDLNEAFFVKRERGPDDPLVRAGRRFAGPNRWPADLPGFRDAVLAYTDAVDALGRRILPLCAQALDLPTDAFDAAFRESQFSFRLTHYPPAPAPTS